MKCIKSVFFFLFLAFSIEVIAQNSWVFNPEIGKTYTYKYQSSEVLLNGLERSNRDMYTDNTIVFTLKAVAINQECITMEYFFNEITNSFNQLSMDVQASSKGAYADDTQRNKDISNAFKKIVNRTFHVQFKPNGSVSYISGIDSLMFSLLNGENNKRNTSDDSFVQSFLSPFKKDIVKNMFESMFMVYPNQPVKINDSWMVETSAPITNMSGRLKRNLTLKSIKKGIAEIEQFSEFDYSKDTSRYCQTMGGLKGTIWMDPKTGMIQKREERVTDKGNQKVLQTKRYYDRSSNIKFSIIDK